MAPKFNMGQNTFGFLLAYAILNMIVSKDILIINRLSKANFIYTLARAMLPKNKKDGPIIKGLELGLASLWLEYDSEYDFTNYADETAKSAYNMRLYSVIGEILELINQEKLVSKQDLMEADGSWTTFNKMETPIGE